MSYSLDLFSPETYDILTWPDRRGSGFRLRHRGMAGRVQLGDRLVCSMTNPSRWVGILEVQAALPALPATLAA